MKRSAWRQAGVGLALALSGWAASAQGSSASVGHDPFEPFNRAMYEVNESLDRAVFKPVATAYRDVTPRLVRTGVTNFFGNVGDVWNLANNVLQLKAQASAETFMRLNVNTVFGLGGLLDIATEVGISRHSEDFGQTLGYWGVPSGPYLMLPLLGPSTIRDTAALPVDSRGNPLGSLNDVPVRNSLRVLDLVDTRARLLGVGNLLETAALDPYSFMRDSYLQRRAIEVRDGAPSGKAEERYDLE